MNARPGFRATDEQFAWFDEARLKAGESSLSEWLRKIATIEAERLLGSPCPQRKPLQKSQKKVR